MDFVFIKHCFLLPKTISYNKLCKSLFVKAFICSICNTWYPHIFLVKILCQTNDYRYTFSKKKEELNQEPQHRPVETIYIILYTVNIWSIPISIVYLFTIFPIVKKFKLMCNIILNLYANTGNVDFKFEQQQWRRYIFAKGGGGLM